MKIGLWHNLNSAPHYQHSEIGYNYRLSNVLVAPIGHLGRGQIRVLEERAQRRVPIGREARRRNFDYYQETLGHLPGIAFRAQWAPALGCEAPWGRHTRRLICMTVDPAAFGATREDLRLALFADGLCLPSGSNLIDEELARVVGVVPRVYHTAQG